MKAVIYSPTKSAMQSGMRNTKHWRIRFENNGSRYIEPLMGWTASRDMLQEVKLKFHTKEEAIAFAQKNKIEYEVLEQKFKKTLPKSYANNFTS